MIPAQPVRAEPSIMAVVGGSKRTLTHHGRPDQSIDVLDRLDLRLDNPHSSKGYPAAARNFNGFNALIRKSHYGITRAACPVTSECNV